MPTSELNSAKEAIPLIGIGLTGAVVRSINHHPFSFRDAAIRVCTSGFTSGLALMYLSTTDYPRALQGVVVGIVGLLGVDLLDAVRIRMHKEITGDDDPPPPVFTEPPEPSEGDDGHAR